MLFKPELIEKIVSGEKTQTRRLVKAKEVLYPYINLDNGGAKEQLVYKEEGPKCPHCKRRKLSVCYETR